MFIFNGKLLQAALTCISDIVISKVIITHCVFLLQHFLNPGYAYASNYFILNL